MSYIFFATTSLSLLSNYYYYYLYVGYLNYWLSEEVPGIRN